MDETCEPFISFGPDGCNHCIEANQRARAKLASDSMDLNDTLKKIRERTRGRFDCVIGVSGGLDSSYLLVKAVELGLRPLAVHMDNNWNSSMASQNLHNLLSRLDVPLITRVTNWKTQRELQKAFFNADVIDIELLYDNCLHEVCYEVAKEFKIKTILGGANRATEGIEVPRSWVWRKFDGRNIRAIANNSHVDVTGYPIFSALKWLVYQFLWGIKWVSLLDFFPEYGRVEALQVLRGSYSYVPYGSKHYENVFTRFYQGYILPSKFGVDKRKPHLSSEILSGHLTRAEALDALTAPIYGDEALLELDRDYVRARLQMSTSQMDQYLTRGQRKHDEFKEDLLLKIIIPRLLRLRRIMLALRSRRNSR